MHTCWTLGPAITLAEILDAREHRAWIQQELLLQKPASLLSFTLNIAGPVKVTPFTKWLYHLGCYLIQRGIQNSTYEYLISPKGQALRKKLLEKQEEF